MIVTLSVVEESDVVVDFVCGKVHSWDVVGSVVVQTDTEVVHNVVIELQSDS